MKHIGVFVYVLPFIKITWPQSAAGCPWLRGSDVATKSTRQKSLFVDEHKGTVPSPEESFLLAARLPVWSCLGLDGPDRGRFGRRLCEVKNASVMWSQALELQRGDGQLRASPAAGSVVACAASCRCP